MEIEFLEDKPAKIQSWKVKEGSFLSVGHVILSYRELDDGGQPLAEIKRLKTTQSGVIKIIHATNGSNISRGSTLATLEPCSHPTVMRDMCAECGKDLRKLDEPPSSAAGVSMIHSVPDLRVSMEQAQKIGKVDEERLLAQEKLVLLVDLDQTLIHTTNDNVPNNLKDVFHFQLWGHGSVWYHTRLRPRTKEFLEAIGKLYELHICTFGTRSYAHVIARHLDPQGQIFSDRILSRDECFSQNSKTANLKELFPRGDHMVCIIDDREDVWNFAPNLIHVKPYHFFRHTGDINAPPGLTKQDQDDKSGFTFNKDGTAVNKVPETPSSPTDEVNDAIKSNENEEKKSGGAQEEEGEGGDTNDSTNSNNNFQVRRVTSDLSLSDEEDSDDHSKASDGDAAADGDKEESCDEKKEIDSGKSGELPQPESKQIPELGVAAAEESPNNLKVEEESKISTGGEPEKEDDIVKETVNNNKTSVMKDDPTKEKELQEQEEVKIEKEKIVDSDIQPASTAAAAEEGISTTDGNNKREIEVEDQDDYLLYLEEILESIHQAFYSLNKQDKRGGENNVPDVKNVVPYVRRKVLKNVSIVFSGVIPTEVPLSERKNTKAYSVAMSLGAHISERIIPPNKPCASSEIPTTHVIAARVGTAKVNEARRYKGIHIVTPDWLWCCSERWKLVDERLFQLYKKSVVNRYPPGHHSSSSSSPHKRRDSPHSETTKNGQMQQKPGARKERTPSGRFMDTINPLLSFSMDEIDSMGHEVDDILNESESSSSSEEDENVFKEQMAIRRRNSRSRSEEMMMNAAAADEEMDASELTKGTSSSSDSSDSESEIENDDFKVCKKRKRGDKTETETEDDLSLNDKFRRGEAVPSEVENLMLTGSDDDDNTRDQDEEWMAQALEREFMDDNSRDTG